MATLKTPHSSNQGRYNRNNKVEHVQLSVENSLVKDCKAYASQKVGDGQTV
jgi:hypothetical protein